MWASPDWGGPHPGYVGGLLTEQPVLIRDESVVAYVTNIRCFPRGFLFCILTQLVGDGREGGSIPPDVVVEFADETSWRENLDIVGDVLIRRGSQSSGGAGTASWSTEYWLPALPPPGPTTFRITVGKQSGAGAVDAALIRAAAERAIDLWSS